MGFAVAQQFVGEVLRRLDLGDFANIVALLANGEHNRILDDLRGEDVSVSEVTEQQADRGARLTLGARVGFGRGGWLSHPRGEGGCCFCSTYIHRAGWPPPAAPA